VLPRRQHHQRRQASPIHRPPAALRGGGGKKIFKTKPTHRPPPTQHPPPPPPPPRPPPPPLPFVKYTLTPTYLWAWSYAPINYATRPTAGLLTALRPPGLQFDHRPEYRRQGRMARGGFGWVVLFCSISFLSLPPSPSLPCRTPSRIQPRADWGRRAVRVQLNKAKSPADHHGLDPDAGGGGGGGVGGGGGGGGRRDDLHQAGYRRRPSFGPGVPAGQSLHLNWSYANGVNSIRPDVQQWKSTRAGRQSTSRSRHRGQHRHLHTTSCSHKAVRPAHLANSPLFGYTSPTAP